MDALDNVEPERRRLDSQESKATSTPIQRQIREPITSPDLSSIGIEHENFNNFTLNLVKSTHHNVTDISVRSDDSSTINLRSSIASQSILDSSLDEEILTRNINKNLFKTQLWRHFKPKIDDTLYHMVLTSPSEIESYVDELLNSFHKTRRAFILSIIKFFVDLCNYQSLKVQEYFDFSPKACEKLVSLMEVDLIDPVLLKTKNYLFKEIDTKHSNIGLIMSTAVYSFIRRLIIGAYERDIIFYGYFSRYVFDFIRFMCFSMVTSIRHTGLIIANKVLTACTLIYNDILQKLDEATEPSLRTDLDQQKKHLEKYIEFFYHIFSKNCLIPDKRLYMIRASFASEMYEWMKNVPSLFFSKQYCLQFLMKLVLDESKVVRLSALKTCSKLLNLRSTELIEYIGDILKVVASRLEDICNDVVLKAINILTSVLKTLPALITKPYLLSTISLIYCPFKEVALAGGKFLAQFLKIHYNNEAKELYKLVELCAIPKYEKLKPLLVESCYEYMDQLTNWDALLNLLLNDDDSEYNRLDLMELIYYSVYQALKGESIIVRKLSKPATENLEVHQEIADAFMSKIISLLKTYKKQPKMLTHFFNILCLIKYYSLSKSYYREHQFVLFFGEKILFKYSNIELIQSVVQLYHRWYYEMVERDKKDTRHVLNQILKKFSGEAKEYLKIHFSEQIEESQIFFEKFSLLYEKFNLNPYLEWKHTLPKEHISICRCMLIWKLKEYMDESCLDSQNMLNLVQKKTFLSRQCSEYTNYLVEVIRQMKGEKQEFEAIENYGTLYIGFHTELSACSQFSDLYKDILPKIPNDHVKILCESIEKFVPSSKQSAIEYKKYILILGKMILNGQVDVAYGTTILRFYNTHEEYRCLIEGFMKKISESDSFAILLLLLNTLIKIFEEIIAMKHVDTITEEMRKLKALAKRFASSKEFKHPSTNKVKFINCAIRYCFRKNTFEFLDILKYFLKQFSDRDLITSLNIFEGFETDGNEKNIHILMFKSLLKDTSKPARKKLKKDTTSAIPVETNMDESVLH